MRPRKMTAKRAGICRQCPEPIEPGDPIFWARGSGAIHQNCETARLRHDQCTACRGAGCSWNGTPCRQCDGTGSRTVETFAHSGGHPRRE